jgi:hypothetical protein
MRHTATKTLRTDTMVLLWICTTVLRRCLPCYEQLRRSGVRATFLFSSSHGSLLQSIGRGVSGNGERSMVDPFPMVLARCPGRHSIFSNPPYNTNSAPLPRSAHKRTFRPALLFPRLDTSQVCAKYQLLVLHYPKHDCTYYLTTPLSVQRSWYPMYRSLEYSMDCKQRALKKRKKESRRGTGSVLHMVPLVRCM